MNVQTARNNLLSENVQNAKRKIFSRNQRDRLTIEEPQYKTII